MFYIVYEMIQRITNICPELWWIFESESSILNRQVNL